MPRARIDREAIEDEDAPDVTDRDWALAKREDGAPVDQSAFLSKALRDLVDALDRIRAGDRSSVDQTRVLAMDALRVIAASRYAPATVSRLWGIARWRPL